MKIKFIGATETVTGSKHLLLTEKGKQFLLDCGLYQGLGKETDSLNRHLGVNPSHIEAVVLSHAHIDHSGNLPFLVKNGFMGKIYCTPATYDACEILLLDSAHIHESDIRYINKRRLKKGFDPLKPLYTSKDAEECLKRFRPIPYHHEFHLCDELSFHFTDVGHIIGSAAINITSNEENKILKLCFSGDVGRYNDLILNAPEPFPQADYIVCESTYGNSIHENPENSELKLLNLIIKTCIEKKGKLIVPAFSLGRTQEIVYLLNVLKNKNLLPKMKVFVDSPLSFKATQVMRKHPECFNETLKASLHQDPDPFDFEDLKYIEDVEDSKFLNEIQEPCMIISASGMGDAGRIKHHLSNTIGNPNNTVLIAGYCSPGTLGADLLAGHKQVHIFGEVFEVKAEVEAIQSLSAHADSSDLLRFLSCQNKEKIKKIFLVHGEAESKLGYRSLLIQHGYREVIIPEKGESFLLS
ncbi:MAG: MBL fold metallo-hydrolase [Bacteroidia bacterium]|jgi:metallo-beta-lactamase family protein|nr:MBL fold metallo-hydrolase [Bacteroidia bacterium]